MKINITVLNSFGNTASATANVLALYTEGKVEAIRECFFTKKNDDNIYSYIVEVEIEDLNCKFSIKAYSCFDLNAFTLGIADYVERKNFYAHERLSEDAVA